MHPALLAISISLAGAIVIGGMVIGGLYLGMKSFGLTVPQRPQSVESLLSFALPQGAALGQKNILPVESFAGLNPKDLKAAKLLQITVDGKLAAVGAFCFNSPEAAADFWARYFVSVSRRLVRKKAFRNNLFAPKFVSGLFGADAKFDITAWHQGSWFFYVGVDRQIPDAAGLKKDLRLSLVNRIKQLDGRI
jgi:hypothetical protein